jgi:hypothetical protein
MMLLENMEIPEEPPYYTWGSPGRSKEYSNWNVWFFNAQRDWQWPNFPEQNRWNSEKYMGSFSPSEVGGIALLKYGSWGYQWSKRKLNFLRLIIFPTALASDMPAGIYLSMEIRKGAASSPHFQPMAEFYFPFKNYKPNKEGMSVRTMLEELNGYHDEILEHMRVLVPYGSKTAKSMPVDKFYETVYPQLQQYATQGMTKHYENYQRM